MSSRQLLKRNQRLYFVFLGLLYLKKYSSFIYHQCMYRLMQDINTNDETSYKRNTESLLQELKRTTANVDVIKQLLKLTFAQRRKEIMEFDECYFPN